ncbi:MAG: hypothetical protein IT373_36975 [Polyangiaceae bacterium]|nr:hypothetical protein [Polyangiaceae bacterium]
MSAPREEPGSERPVATVARRGGRFGPALLFLGVFVLGGVAGGGIVRACTLSELRSAIRRGPPAQAFARFRIEALRRHLELGDEQVEQIRAILEQAQQEQSLALASCSPDLEERRARVDAAIAEVLTPEQRAAYAELQAREPPGPGPRGPHRPPGHPPR